MEKFVLTVGSYGRHEKQKEGHYIHRVYKRGDEIDLSATEAKALASRIMTPKDHAAQQEKERQAKEAKK